MLEPRLSLHIPVGGAPETLRRRLAGDPQAWLPPPARPRGIEHWTVDLAAGRLHHRVACGVGMVWTIGEETWRTVTWHAVTEPHQLLAVQHALPTFRGKLTLTAHDGEAVLALEGSYRPPGGLFGVLADKALLHTVAEATASWFLRTVADRLSAEPVPRTEGQGAEERAIRATPALAQR